MQDKEVCHDYSTKKIQELINRPSHRPPDNEKDAFGLLANEWLAEMIIEAFGVVATVAPMVSSLW